MNIYIVLEEPVDGLTYYPAKVIGAFTNKRSAERETLKNAYRYIVIRELEE